MPFKPMKFVLMTHKGYNGTVFVVKVYEPTRLPKLLRNPISVITGCKITNVGRSRTYL